MENLFIQLVDKQSVTRALEKSPLSYSYLNILLRPPIRFFREVFYVHVVFSS